MYLQSSCRAALCSKKSAEVDGLDKALRSIEGGAGLLGAAARRGPLSITGTEAKVLHSRRIREVAEKKSVTDLQSEGIPSLGKSRRRHRPTSTLAS